MKHEIKIVTWNCCGAFRKKFSSIEKMGANIYIIQECEDPGRTNDLNYREWAKNFIWTGDNKNKGLGVFFKPGVLFENLNWETDGLKFFISCRIDSDFNLLATWCHGANSSTFAYIGQMWKYLQIHKSKLGKSIIAGDFNSNSVWDKRDRLWNHSDVVKELAELGIESVYHRFMDEMHGKESQPTFFLQKNCNKPYHIDYIFTSTEFADFLASMTIGAIDEWLALSDHLPVFLSINRGKIIMQ